MVAPWGRRACARWVRDSYLGLWNSVRTEDLLTYLPTDLESYGATVPGYLPGNAGRTEVAVWKAGVESEGEDSQVARGLYESDSRTRTGGKQQKWQRRLGWDWKKIV